MRWLVFLLPQRRLFDAVIDAVAQYVDQGVFHLLQNPPVNFDLASLNDQLHLLRLVAGQFTGKPRKQFEQRRERQQVHLLHIVKQVVGHSGQRALVVFRGVRETRQSILERFHMQAFAVQILEQLRELLLIPGSAVNPVPAPDRPFDQAQCGLNPRPFLFPCRKHSGGFAQLPGALTRCQPRRQQFLDLPHHRVEFRRGNPDRFGCQAERWRCRVGGRDRGGRFGRRSGGKYGWEILRRRSRRGHFGIGQGPFQRIVQAPHQFHDRRPARAGRAGVGSQKPAESVDRLVQQIEQGHRDGEMLALQRREYAFQRLADRLDLRQIHGPRGPLQAVRLAENLLDEFRPLHARRDFFQLHEPR